LLLLLLLLLLLQVSGVMKTMVPSLPLPELLGYAVPFPTPRHKAAVERAPRLAALAVLTAQQLATCAAGAQSSSWSWLCQVRNTCNFLSLLLTKKH
jgi:hypothetical protein